MHGRCILDAVKLIHRAAVGDHGDCCLGAGQSGREQHGVRTARDIHHSVRMTLQDGTKQFQDLLCVVDVHIQELHRGLDPAVGKVILQLPPGMLRRSLRADVDHLFRAENLHAQYIFQRPLVKQFNQCLCFHP